LDSILNNKFNEFEIIIVNDGSTDNSSEILKGYAKNHGDKIRVFNQENQGVAKARNNGIKYAEKKYVMFIDNDDWVDSDYLEKYLDEIETKSLDMVIGGYKRTTQKKILFEVKLEEFEWSKYMVMAPWAKIYSREFLLKNKIEFLENNIGEDVYFNLQAVNLTDKISIFDYCGYSWFYNEKSVSNTSQKSFENNLNVMHLLNSCYGRLKEVGAADKEEVEFYFIRYVVWYLLFVGRKSSYNQIREEFVKTFAWLNEKFPEFQKNKNISMKRPRGETLKNRVIVYAFLLLYRLKLINIFLKLYATR
jgi:glycosyltransferase involved in cell wall biosynthesis